MSYDNNPYYHPEKFGLTTVGEVSWGEESYSFDLTVVWRDEAGQLYFAEDAGCSCPSPFEDYEGLVDLERLSREQVVHQLKLRLSDNSYDQEHDEAEVADLIERLYK